MHSGVDCLDGAKRPSGDIAPEFASAEFRILSY
jgi:hypothetical protein